MTKRNERARRGWRRGARLTLALALAGCRAPQVASFEVDEPPETVERDPKPKEESSSKTAPPLPNDPSPSRPSSSRTWVGVLRSTSTVRFGGSGYCDYSIRMEDVRLQLTVDAAGTILAVNLAATAIEEAPQCQQRPIPRNVHSYEYAANTNEPRAPVTLSGSSTNEPHAKATIEAVALEGTTPHASIRWQREDTTDPLLKWIINESVPVRLDR